MDLLNKVKNKIPPKTAYNVERYFFMMVATVASAVCLYVFLTPAEIVSGGVTGLATLIGIVCGVSQWQGVLQLLINIPIMILSYKQMGKRFIIDCLINLVIRAVVIDLMGTFLPAYRGDKLLAAVYAGVLWGIAIGLYLKYKISSGGTEMLGRWIYSKIPVLSMPATITVLDLTVVFVGVFVLGNPEGLLYAMVMMFISTCVSDVILVGFRKSKQCLIVTDKPQEVAAAIMNEIRRGVTKIDATGMYSGGEKGLLMVCVASGQLENLRAVVKRADEKSFLIVGSASEVYGAGFNDINKE